ncbi:gluconate 5-dehydrogenase [Lasallia pustulata]|uniref:Gluconate 5-dehydrogenase n=1 Tax=Lasallia pustulata TaxID=136370 RepID=A0A1W5D488_9LECA|nr:gluconate 5-dehydrogenase [Lasallia pustulata]
MNGANSSTPNQSLSGGLGRLRNKVAIITGASSGLGRAITLAYAREGAHVVCADLQPTAKEDIKDEAHKATHHVVQQNGGKSIFVRCDVGDSEDVKNLVEAAVKEYGRLDIMVNNAGIALESSLIHETADETFDKTIRVNARSVFLGCKYATGQMLKQEPHVNGDRGWIINTASVMGLVGFPGIASYCASKGAVVQLTRQVALDYAPHRIHCNALCPGFTQTAMIATLTSQQDVKAQLDAAHPFRGLGEPEDIAKAAVFLASDDASWITGVPLAIDGGYTAR